MRKFLNHWLLLGVISVGIISCGKDDPAPPPKVHKASFTAVLGTATITEQVVTVTNTTAFGKSYSWNFGDGSAPVVTTSLTPAATHTYKTAGKKTITLTSTAADGAAPATSVDTEEVTVVLLPNTGGCTFGANLAKGDFEDDADWTYTASSAVKPDYTIGATTKLPATAVGKGMLWKLIADKGPDGIISQKVNLDAGTYLLSVDVRASGGFKYWFEWYLTNKVPEAGKGMSALAPLDMVFQNTWKATEVAEPVNGDFAPHAQSYGSKVDDVTYYIDVPSGGDYYIALGFGHSLPSGDLPHADLGIDGVAVDNLKLVKVTCPE